MATPTLQAGSIDILMSLSVRLASNTNAVPDTLSPGSTLFPTLRKTLQSGTGSNKASKGWWDKRTIGAGLDDDLNLLALRSMVYDYTWSFSLIKWLLIRVRDALTGQYVTLGNATTDPWQGWFGAATATETVYGTLFKENQIDGWTVTQGSRVLRLHNNYTASVNVDVVLVGQ